jgi:hypothetical protein
VHLQALHAMDIGSGSFAPLAASCGWRPTGRISFVGVELSWIRSLLFDKKLALTQERQRWCLPDNQKCENLEIEFCVGLALMGEGDGLEMKEIWFSPQTAHNTLLPPGGVDGAIIIVWWCRTMGAQTPRVRSRPIRWWWTRFWAQNSDVSKARHCPLLIHYTKENPHGGAKCNPRESMNG